MRSPRALAVALAPGTRSGSVYQFALAQRPSAGSPAPQAAPIGCAATRPQSDVARRGAACTAHALDPRPIGTEGRERGANGRPPQRAGPSRSSLPPALSSSWEGWVKAGLRGWVLDAGAPRELAFRQMRRRAQPRWPAVGCHAPAGARRASERDWRGGGGRS